MTHSNEEAWVTRALARPAEKRAALLDAICDGDPALRAGLPAGRRQV